jgi:hypothetical protein
MPGVNRRIGHADFESGAQLAQIDRRHVGVALEAVLAGVFIAAGLDLDQADVEPGGLVAGKGQRAGDMNGANRLVGIEIVGDGVPGANLHARRSSGDLAAVPCRRRRPGAALRRANPRGGILVFTSPERKRRGFACGVTRRLRSGLVDRHGAEERNEQCFGQREPGHHDIP